ncbi:MAG: hypothetical protein V8S39_08595 [Lachnospiraceae bacterium]
MTSEEYVQKILELMNNPQIMKMFYLYFAGMILVSLLVCFLITRASKLPKKYILFGLLGVTGIMIVICRAMAASAGMSPHFMWLGLFGFYGIIAVAIIMVVRSANGEKNQPVDMNIHPQNKNEEEKQGYNLNGTYHEHDSGTICLNCGSAVEAGETICPHCGNRVR